MIRTTILVLLSTYIQIYELHNFIKIILEIYSVLMNNNNGIIPYITNVLNKYIFHKFNQQYFRIVVFQIM